MTTTTNAETVDALILALANRAAKTHDPVDARNLAEAAQTLVGVATYFQLGPIGRSLAGEPLAAGAPEQAQVEIDDLHVRRQGGGPE